ncbi:transcription factor Tfb2 [Necator americanus]|uniref:General transcription factor IIH subunit 4 n=1 Tax=Necator americanus TaxID=51031 RepID=W2TRW7_NECAM|nr:transcription factor Tfb2 [Necator americanus]ETN84785.1 transcription factor Tfb2 [Necator americanus]
MNSVFTSIQKSGLEYTSSGNEEPLEDEACETVTVKMSGRKKAQKKKGRTKEIGVDDFDDLVENANDDGCGLSRKFATDIIRLIKCHTKPLSKVAAEFIEIFKDRCSLVVGMALLAIYDDLASTDDIASKIVTVYLVYRVRDIEVALRRRNPGGIDDILGHPFMSFFLNLANLGFTEAEQYYVKQTARWPEHLDMVTIPAILPFPDPEDNSLHDLTQDALLMSLMQRISCEPLKQLPFKTTPLMPPLYPIQPIELGCDDFDELRNRVADTNPPTPGTSKEKTKFQNHNLQAPISAVPNSSQELTEEQMAEFTKRLLDGKSLTQSETKQMLKSLERADANNKFVNQFVQMSDADLSRLIDLNVKIAIEVIDLCVSADQALANRVMRIVQGMDVTVQCMEVVTRLYQYRPELSREPLNDYVRYCVRYCLDAIPSSNLNRVVRLVAITLKNLLKSGSISASELSLELREFGVRFCQHPDTTFLFNTVGLAQLRDARETVAKTLKVSTFDEVAVENTATDLPVDPMAAAGTLPSSGNLFLDYICTLSNDDRSFLYAQPACDLFIALFVFRMLPSVSQQIVIKMIWNPSTSGSFSLSNAELESSHKLLIKLGIVGGSGNLHPSFRQSYLRSIMLGTQKCAKIKPVEVDSKRKQNEKELGKKAGERWECILRYLALPSDKNMNSVSSTTRELFSAAGFTSDSDGSLELEITSAGFQFLLLSPVQQLWTYMIEYLKLENSKGRDIRPIIDLLIRVILCVVIGGDFSNTAFEINTGWTEEQTTLVMHMRELGLIFIRKRKDG